MGCVGSLRCGKRPLALLALLVAAGALGGCGINRVIPKGSKDFYSPAEVGAAFGGKDAWVKIDGNPFTIDQGGFEATVLRIVRDNWSREPANFTTTPGESANRTYKLTIVFNAAEGLAPDLFCGDQRIETAPADAEAVIIDMAFCRNASVVNAARGYVYDLGGPADPALATVIGDMVTTVFPRELVEPNNHRKGIRLY